MSKITSDIIRFSRNYEHKLIHNFWEQNTVNVEYQSFTLDEILDLSSQYICMIHESKLSLNTLQKISSIFERGIRTYIVTSQIDSKFNYYANRVRLHVSSIYGRGHFVLIINLDGTKRLFIQKNNSQYVEIDWMDDMYHHFIYCFWHYENRTVYSSSNSAELMPDAPELIPMLKEDSEIIISNEEYDRFDNTLIELIISAQKSITLSHDSTDFIKRYISHANSKIDKNIIIPRIVVDDTVISQFVDLETKIHVIDDTPKSYIRIDDRMFIIEESKDGNHKIMFEVEPKQNISNYLQPSEWYSYVSSKQLKELVNKKIVINNIHSSDYKKKYLHEVQERLVYEDNVIVTIESVKEKKYNLESYEKIGYSDNYFACNIDFILRFIPKSIDPRGVKDKLYAEWNNFRHYANSNIDLLEKSIAKANEEALKLNLMEYYWARLTGKKSNYNRILKDLQNHRKKLNEVPKYEYYFDMIDYLNKINEDLRNDQNDLKQLKDENEQHQKFIQKKDMLMQTIKLKEESIGKKKNEYESKNEELNMLINDIEEVKKQISAIENEILKIETDENDMKEVLKEEDIQQYRDKLIEFNNQKLELINNKQELNKDISNNELKITVLKQQISKLKDIMDQEKKSLDQDQLKLSSSEYNSFQYIPNVGFKKADEALQSVSKKQLKNQKNQNKEIYPPFLLKDSVPTKLPNVGNLYTFQNRRFLAISDWNEYGEGIIEAQRLQAELVAEKEDSNERE